MTQSGQGGQMVVTGQAPASLVPYRTEPRPPLRIDWPSQPGRPGDPVPLRDRWCFPTVFLISLVVFISTDTGRMIFDTKLGVDIDAAGFLTRLWQLWNPLEWFGMLQNQYIGYSIPMAPFFLLGQLARVPVWVIERVWLATLVTVGFVGLVRLARALGIGTQGTRLVAAAVFALWPTFTIVIGSTSAAALPGLMLPWAILPLVGAIHGGRTPGRAAALSGLAVTAMGGVNAASTGCVLIAVALFIVTQISGRRRITLLARWTVAVLAGTAWWLVPLLLQGRYSFNVLPYTEQSAITFGTMAAAAFLRGAGNWTAYLNLGAPSLPAGWSEVTTPVAIVGSALAAGTGLYGLARRDMPARRWLLASVGVATVIALSGYSGTLGDPWSATTDALFNGALAPLRNVYKLEPVIAAAMALGCAHALSQWSRAELPVRAGRLPVSAAIAPLAAFALVGLAVPQLSGQVLNSGSFSRVPAYWYQVAGYLATHSPRQTALVVPGDAHGEYLWGEPSDDPLEPLASSPWAERSLQPNGGAGSQAFLTTVEQAVESGQAVPGLPAYLARAGIRYVVVRNDLSPALLGYVSPQVVNETMAQSGFERVAAFGPLVRSFPSYPQSTPLKAGPQPRYPAVEVFQAASVAWRPTSPVSALPTASTVLVNGGPDSLLQLAGQKIVTTAPTVIAGDPLPVRPALWAITDGQRREDDIFGMTTQNFSFPYTATETNPPDSLLGAAGEPPRQLLPVPAAGHQTVAVLAGAAQVTASSYGSWLVQEPQYDPVNAFDGNPATAWAESSLDPPDGQWIQVTFGHARDLPASIGIQLLTSGPDRAIATQVQVSTAAGTATTSLARTSATQPVRVRPGSSGWLRVTITKATVPLAAGLGAGFSDVLIPGVRVTRYLEPAEDPAGTVAPSVAYSFSQSAASPLDAAGPQSSEVLARTFLVPSVQRVTVTGQAVPTAGSALEALTGSLARLNLSAGGLAAPFRFGCGQGPVLRVDGRSYPTAVSGTLSDLLERLPVQVSMCTRGSQLSLSGGQHWLQATPSAAFVVTSLDLRTVPAAAGPGADLAPDSAPRQVQVIGWADDDRSLRIGPGQQSYVEIHENFNAGWAATLGGRALTAVELDGWQQAFVVPAGQGGLIKLKYTPVTIYHAGLIAAGAALVVLAVIAILPGRWRERRRARRARRRQARQRHRDARRGRASEPGESVPWTPQPWGTADLSRPAAGQGGRTAGRLSRLRAWGGRRRAIRLAAVFLPLAAVIAIAGGPVVVAVPLLAGLAYWRPRLLPWVGFAAMLAAGAVAATSYGWTPGRGAFGGVAQACALVALTAALLPDTTGGQPLRPTGHRQDAS
ncbi:MAG TPA: alpha-(1-_3)-arabinofuranosyltransferase family protein [Trebonia sp.]|nr:alpha-(1->3)-arabinofuranosyltransferase family protein [Trebonia sp.]